MGADLAKLMFDKDVRVASAQAWPPGVGGTSARRRSPGMLQNDMPRGARDGRIELGE